MERCRPKSHILHNFMKMELDFTVTSVYQPVLNSCLRDGPDPGIGIIKDTSSI